MDLREYEQVKFELAALLRSADACDLRDPQGRHAHDDLVRDLFSRLAEDRFNLVVVGRFSRGKTSLMNAVLATDRLPTGIRPLTSVITTVTYGSQEKAVIHYENSLLPEDIPLAALPRYITEQGNSANRRRVRIAEVQLPAELLRRGFHFIDTPGLGSPILENTRTTERFLPEADAFVLVTSHEGPLSEEELRFLDGSGRRVFIIVNKQDMVSPEERAEALRYLREQLLGAGVEDSAVFSVSARDGLAAKRARDTKKLADSGIAAFEDALVRFLIDDKSREFLRGMCQRIGAFLRDLPRQPEAARLGEQLAIVAGRIDPTRSGAAPAFPAGPAIAMPREEVLAKRQIRPCEICVHATRQSYDFLRQYQYDIIVSPDRQRELAERNGLCSFHIWGYEAVASPHGTCAGFAVVLDRLAAQLSGAAASPSSPSVSAPPPGPVPEPSCIVCETRAAAEAAAVEAIAARLRQNAENALHSLSDLCIPHFRLLAEAIADPAVAARLFTREAALFQRVAEDMRRFALKHEGVRRHLASEEETKAAQRALMLLGGHRTLNTPVTLAQFRLRQPADAAE